MWIMNPTTSAALELQGNSNINAPGCGIYVNSSNNNAVKVIGNSNNFNGPDLDVVGGLNGHQTSPTPITTNTAPISPPIPMNLTGPVPPADAPNELADLDYHGQHGKRVRAQAGTTWSVLSNAVTLGDGVTLPGCNKRSDLRLPKRSDDSNWRNGQCWHARNV